jgi:hypothetical protein
VTVLVVAVVLMPLLGVLWANALGLAMLVMTASKGAMTAESIVRLDGVMGMSLVGESEYGRWMG